MSTDPEKLQAALEQLKRERETMIAAAVESGAAIRVPVVVMTTTPGDIDAALEKAKECKIEELRQGGEKREIFVDKIVVNTGVPRTYGESNVSARKSESVALPVPELQASDQAPAQPQPIDIDVEEIAPQRFYVQTEAPSGLNPEGSVLYGWYEVKKNVLEVHDDQGRLLATQVVKSGDDFLAIARQLLRDKSAQ